MSSWPRRAALASLTVVVSLMLGLLVSEGIARVLLDPPRYHREPVALDAELGFSGIPGLAYRMEWEGESHEVVFNRDGLRGRELPSGPAPEGVERIAFLGDSFLVAEAVAEEFLVTTRVEAALAERGRAAEVYNLSAVDWSTGQQLLYLDAVGDALSPDTVVLAFFQGNDVVNNSMGLANATSTSPGDPIRPYVIPEPEGGWRVEYVDPGASWFRRHSRIYATLEQRFRPFAAGGDNMTRRERLKMGRMPLEELEVFRRHAPVPRWERAWEESFALLSAVQERCDALGARLIVLALPAVHQVRETAEAVRFGAEFRVHARRPLESLVDWNEPDRRLAGFFRASGIEGVMLLSDLREAARNSGDVYARDAHLAADGHAVVADAVLAALAGPVPDPNPATGIPVPFALDPDRFRLLDFARESRADRVAGGWLVWREEQETRPWGWSVGPAAMVALEPGSGPLVVRGSVDPRVQLPVAVTVKVIGAPIQQAMVRSAGAFELRFVEPPRGVPNASGHVSLLIATNPAGGFYVEAVGFEAGED